MPLVKRGRIVDDPYLRIVDDAPIPEGTAIIVPATRFTADAAELTQRTAPTGLIWPNDRKVAELAPWLDRLALIALTFPNFRDGRAYSQARQLRERYGFHGELRATGEILREQFLFLIRAGFDSLEVKKAADAAVFAEAVGRYSVFYQPSANGSAPVQRRRLLHAAAGVGERIASELVR
jgi:uncharacterized protein (DUF934 family)